jgi:ankyrin repeat protein
MYPSMAARLLFAQTKINPDRSHVLSAISRAVQALGQQTDEQRLDNTRVVCEAAAEHLHAPRTLTFLKQAAHSFSDGENAQHTLSAAIVTGNAAMVRALLANADVNADNTYFGRPLPLAARWGHLEIVQLLLTRGADVNASGNYERTAAACDDEYYGGSALRAASLVGQDHIVQALLESRHGLLTSGAEYEKAVLAATRGGHANLVRVLLEKWTGRYPASLSQLHHEIFWEASYGGHEVIVGMMLENGVDVNAERGLEQMYISALQHAAVHGYDKVMRLLLQRGADPNFAGGYNGPVINNAVKNGHEEAVQLLLDYGANIHGIDDHTRPLVVAAKNGQVHMIQFLLRQGTDINALDYDVKVGSRALTSAVYRGLSPVVRVLVEAGVPPNNPNQTHDSVLSAMILDSRHVLDTLFELGAQDVDPLQSIFAEEFQCGRYPDPVELQVDGLVITQETCHWVGKH